MFGLGKERQRKENGRWSRSHLIQRTMFLSVFAVIILIFGQCRSNRPVLVDLTHTILPTIPYFPSQTRFNFTARVATWTNGENSFFYSTNSFVSSEHMGTHLDAPYHFDEFGWKVDEIPLEYLTSINARIVDVSKKCEQDPNYLITVDDVKKSNFIVPTSDEQENGERFRFVLLFHTGWAKFWPDQEKYGGNEENLQFPGLSESLAKYLIKTYGDQLVGVGIDTLSIDHGPSKNFSVHQILAKNNKYGLENVAAMNIVLSYVNEEFFPLQIFPMKIGNGTGGPCRIVTYLTRNQTAVDRRNRFGLLIFFVLFIVLGVVLKIIYDFNFNPNKEF